MQQGCRTALIGDGAHTRVGLPPPLPPDATPGSRIQGWSAPPPVREQQAVSTEEGDQARLAVGVKKRIFNAAQSVLNRHGKQSLQRAA